MSLLVMFLNIELRGEEPNPSWGEINRNSSSAEAKEIEARRNQAAARRRSSV